MFRCHAAAIIFFVCTSTSGESAAEVTFDCWVLTEEFHSEGAAIADFNSDGHQDVVSGPFWYAGPTFRQRHRYMPGEPLSIKGYSQHFFSFTHDFDRDQKPDILAIGMPGQPAYWYRNPGNSESMWERYRVLDDVGNESPAFTDLTSNGRPELVCVHAGNFGFAAPNPKSAMAPWTFTPISRDRKLGVFTHGLGVGDVNNDQQLDVLETHGWYQQPRKTSTSQFVQHRQAFAQSGGAQMFAYDFDGDGDNDVLSVQNAHSYGLNWYERRGAGDDFLWVRHEILPNQDHQIDDQLSISQMHGVALADIDGDGIKDIVTGKRFFAHGGGDPGAFDQPVLYWFRTTRENGGVRFEPHLIHQRVGVGTQLTTGDVNGDGNEDIVVGNKLGTFVLVNRGTTELARLRTHARTSSRDFSLGVRESDPRSPAEEQDSFVLPEGFEIELVAAEPDIAKPLNMAFDARGRLWVTDSLEYPFPVEVGTPGRDTIKVLEDVDGDGQIDNVTTFADGLNIPMGLYPYGDGVICFSIPNIWYLRDTDGDGKCDQREILLGPFDHTRDAHGLCNAFTRGFDGWLYACHGFNNQSDVTGPDGNQVVMHSGNTFRFRLDGSRIEHFTHGQVNPFGMSYDARGNLLTADCHTKPVTLLLKDGYYESFGKPHDGLGFVPDVMQHLHGSTAIGGIAVTPDNPRWPPAFRRNTFGGNVMTSRINRNSLHYTGSTIQAREESDFLVSEDSWFRPVDLKFGPDGALYIADFYNRIIGHYEVDLHHPGRDRRRGRIWRVNYRPNENRRDVELQAEPAVELDLTRLSIPELTRRLALDNPTMRILAMNELIDQRGEDAIPSLRNALPGAQSLQKIHIHWCLLRLDSMKAEDITAAVMDSDAMVRAHAQRMIGAADASDYFPHKVVAWLKSGIEDSNADVVRAAATASTNHQCPNVVPPLLQAWNHADRNDVHLLHALKIAVRHQLNVDDSYLNGKPAANQIPFLANVCLGLRSTTAGDFVARNLTRLQAGADSRLTEYCRFVALYATTDCLPEMVELVRTEFAPDEDLQMELLESVRNGLLQRNRPVPALVRQWALSLSEKLVAFESNSSPLPWSHHPHPETGDANLAWTTSTKRHTSDGAKNVLLWSSFPNGEQRTGILRSGVFALPSIFEFFLAGHDGAPEVALQNNNLVLVRDAASHTTLKTWSPPGHDTAQRVTWHTGDIAGTDVYMECVDGDTAGAFAWLAVGRFSESQLNPSDLLERRIQGLKLVEDFALTSLIPRLQRLLTSTNADISTRRNVARTLAKLRSSSVHDAVAETMQSPHLNKKLMERAVDLLTGPADDGLAEYLEESLQFTSSVEQARIAATLATDLQGCEVLVQLVESGHLRPQVLRSPQIETQLHSLASADVLELAATLTASMPSEDEAIEAGIRRLLSSYLSDGGDANRGRVTFEQNCATCHQVAGKGNSVGPNLDGIGNRGLERVVEDVFASNRNIDVAFHATTLLLESGRVITGLAKSTSDATLEIVDSQGKRHTVQRDTIDQQKVSRLSPMPANFHSTLPLQQQQDLVAYLLELTH